LLYITNRAKPHWNLLSAARVVCTISKYNEWHQLHYAIDEFTVPAFIGPDVMGDGVDDIDIMFDWYHSISWAGYYFPVHAFMSESLAFFFCSLIYQGKKYNVEEDDS
jgi:hypothetical protein